jgi:hypothetical protein
VFLTATDAGTISVLNTSAGTGRNLRITGNVLPGQSISGRPGIPVVMVTEAVPTGLELLLQPFGLTVPTALALLQQLGIQVM